MKNKLLSIISPDQLIQDFNELGSTIKIAKKYHINPITVYSAFKIINFNCSVNADAKSIFTKELLKKEYAELQSFNKIAIKYNVSKETVREYIHKFNIEYNELKIYGCDHNFFSRENEETFYIAGFIAADGCVKSRNRTPELSIGLAKKDKEFLENIRKVLKAETPVRDYFIKHKKQNPNWNDTWKSEIIITSEKIVSDLAKFNVVPRKSLIYTFPEWLIKHPLVHHYMRGYNDGDGSFYVPRLAEGKITKQVYFSLRGTVDFLNVYRDILIRECGEDIKNKTIRISSGHGCLEYGGNGVVSKIAQFLYRDATICLPRKKEIIKHLL